MIIAIFNAWKNKKETDDKQTCMSTTHVNNTLVGAGNFSARRLSRAYIFQVAERYVLQKAT